MKIYNFILTFQTVPVFSVRDIEKYDPGFEKENLLNWQKKGYIHRVRNGWYSVAGSAKSLHDLYFIANKIYAPSYVSLMSAFAHYGWIPEGVFTVTSIATLKTNSFQTPVGAFTFNSIKPSLFFGYKILKNNNLGVKMVEPEKAILDFLYLHPDVSTGDDFDAYRFDTSSLQDQLDEKKLWAYAALFNMPALSKRLTAFLNYVAVE